MRNQFRNRTGAVLPLLAAVTAILILVLSLMVELNWLYKSRFEAQSASDLATRSALARLYNNTEDLDADAIFEAKSIGFQVYESNFPSNPVTETELTFGMVLADKSFEELNTEGDFVNITAANMDRDHQFTSLLGTLMAKEDINLPVFSIAEASRFEMVLVLDASRSMNRAVDQTQGQFPPGGLSINEPPLEGSRWFALDQEVGEFLESLSSTSEIEKSQMALVTFGGGLIDHPFAAIAESPLDPDWARLEVEFNPISTSKNLTKNVMAEYSGYPALGVGTSIFDGIQTATNLLENSSAPANQYIILFSDGQQVVDGQRPSELVAAERAVELEIPIYTIAYATDPSALEQIAEDTGGQAFSASNQAELNEAFAAIASSLSSRITQ